MKARKISFAALAILLSLAVSLGCAEAVFRLFHVQPQRFPPARYLAESDGAYHDWGGMWGKEPRDGQIRYHIKRPSSLAADGVKMGEYVPGARFKIVYASNPRGYFDADGSVPVTINSLGLRGPEVAADKLADTFRILGIGDSFTFGVGVRDGDTFLRRLEASLNQRRAPPPRYQVLNAAVQGYNTRDEVLNLERRWLALKPDLVVIGFYLNDAYNDAAFFNGGEVQGVYIRQPDGLARFSYVWDYAQHALQVRRAQKVFEKYYQRHYFSDAQKFLQNASYPDIDWAECRAALLRAVALSREHHFKIAMVIFPEFYELDGSYPFAQIHKLVRDTASGISLPTLDLLDVYRGQRAEDLWVHVTDHHPNEKAHKMAAAAFEEFLVREKLLP